MTPLSVHELADQQIVSEVNAAYGVAKTNEDLVANCKKFAQTERMMLELMTCDGKQKTVPKINLKEAVHTADFKILFPRVVMQILQRPQEGNYIGQTLLARTIPVEGAQIMEFPVLGAMRAHEVAESQEIKEQDPSFSKNITEIRVRRFGVRTSLHEDAITDSQWDIVGLTTEQAGNALARKKEELIFNEYETRAYTVFDNSLTNPARWTSGLNSNLLNNNATFGHEDLLDMMAVLGANGYNPTDVIVHPLAWSIWAKDPFLRFQLLHNGGFGQTLGNFTGNGETMGPTFVPFGLNVVVTPFQTVTYNTNPNTGCATGGTFDYTTITVTDRQQSIVILQKSPPRLVEWENPARDIRTMQFDEKWGISILNGGRSSVTAKNIKIDKNHSPVYTIRSQTVT